MELPENLIGTVCRTGNPYFIGIGTVMAESYDNKYRIGVYGSRNICQKVCSLTKAESSFCGGYVNRIQRKSWLQYAEQLGI